MKQTLYYILQKSRKGGARASIIALSAMPIAVLAGSPADPSITDISIALKKIQSVAPNLFLSMDDSGSMDQQSFYDPAIEYKIPPNPDSFDVDTLQFNPFDISGIDESKNGFSQSAPQKDFSRNSETLSVPSDVCGEWNLTRSVAVGTPAASDFAYRGQFVIESGLKYYVLYDYASRSYQYHLQLDDIVTDDQKANCKIYKAFHSTRMLALKSSLAIAVTNQKKPFSLDYDFINNDGTDGISLKHIDKQGDTTDYKDAVSAFLTNLYAENPSGGTSTKIQTLGLYNRIENNSTVVSTDNIFLPHNSTSKHDNKLSCKQNFAVILSDGEYNQGFNGATVANSKTDWDGTNKSFTFPNLDGLGGTINSDFKGDGSIADQRLFAGGSNTLTSGNRMVWNGARWVQFRDVSRVTLSDIVFHGWANDLNNSLDDEVPPNINATNPIDLTDSASQVATLTPLWNPQNDPANWQRIVTFTIGLGIGEEWTNEFMADVLNANTGATNGLVTSSASKTKWPVPLVADGQNTDQKIGDFVRAGYVGRGGFYRVDNSNQLLSAFEKIFKKINKRTDQGSASGAATSASQITTQSSGIVFKALSNPSDRTGNIEGTWLYNGQVDIEDPLNPTVNEAMNPGGSEYCYGPGHSTAPPSGSFLGQMCTESGAKWNAGSKMKVYTQRNIFSYEPDAAKGIDFKYSSFNTAQKQHIKDIKTKLGNINDENSQPVDEQYIVDFISGRNNMAGNNGFIKRLIKKGLSPLGDFGRGGPRFLGKPNVKAWYKNTKWLKEADQNELRNRAVAFVGSNDGMLHAFDGINGDELFAYIPNAVFSNLFNLVLADGDSAHKAFADGKVATADIIDINDDSKKTILVAGMGKGAKGLFALDVTDPKNFDEDKVLWETSSPDLGYILAEPSIIRVEGKYKGKENRWVVVVGTGYSNDGGKNGVMVLDAISGEELDFLELPTAQGVGEIAWIDHQVETDSDVFDAYLSENSLWGEMDRGYVGDLNGNLWVLDFAYDKNQTDGTMLRSAVIANSNNTEVSTVDSFVQGVDLSDIVDDKPAPLFIATDKTGKRQAISSVPYVLEHPTNRGYMVYFGTGELFDLKPMSEAKNSMYGIWDDITDNIGVLATSDMQDYNKTRDRRYMDDYKWTQQELTFANGDGATARLPHVASTGIKRMKWANFHGNADSSSAAGSPTSIASGWVVDTGAVDPLVSNIQTSERVFQSPFFVVNRKKEEGISFLMSVIGESKDPCKQSKSGSTWNMTFRTDATDGPFTPFTTAQSDYNGDGKIDQSDSLSSGFVPLGAVSGTSPHGVEGVEYSPVTTQSPSSGLVDKVATGDFCSGSTRSQKRASNKGNMKEVNICLPRNMSSWIEIE